MPTVAETQQGKLADAHFNLGNSLRKLGKLNEASASYQQALRLKPDHVQAQTNLGGILMEQGRLEEAAAHFQEALRVKPDCAEAFTNLGNVLSRQDKPDEAINSYRQAVQLKPNVAEGWFNLGIALKRQDRLDEAIVCFRQALQLKPNYAEACNNLGNALTHPDQLDEAITWYQEAIRFKPSYEVAYLNWGNVLVRQNKLDEAARCYRRALDLKPDYAAAHNTLGGVLLQQGQMAGALAHIQQALRLQPDLTTAQTILLFCMNYDPQANPDVVFAEHRHWGRLQEPASAPPKHVNVPDPERLLRVGYVSPDFRFHPVTRYFEPVLASHDPQQVEVFCYAQGSFSDAVTSRLQKLAPNWRWTSRLTDAQVAERIRGDKIDILVDLAGHTANSRLCVFAHKPAPVQATWLGYLNTTGLTSVDYRLTDDVLDPPGQPVRDTEELVRLPGGMCCFAPPVDAPAVTPLPALGRGHLTFGSLHSLFKLNSRVFDLWSEVLKAVPTARLLMFRHTLTGTAHEYVHRQFTDRGIAGERLDLRKGSSAPGNLGIFGEIDLTLDAFPCTGGVTTCESLWMGVPVVSLRGLRPAARNSAALLTRVGMADWVALTPEQYVALAVRHASDLDRLAQLRAQLRDRVRTTLCDAKSFTQMLEEAYRTMWRRWCNQRTGS